MDSGQRLLRGLKAQKAQEEAQEELKKLTEAQRQDIRRGKIHYLREEARPDWTGYAPFYLFWCSSCQRYYKDYRHGHRPYVTCHRCLIYYSLEPWWTPLVVARDSLRLAIKMRFGKL